MSFFKRSSISILQVFQSLSNFCSHFWSCVERYGLKYNIYQIESEPKKFIVIEAWEDENALDGHKASKHYKHYKSNYEVHTADKFSENLLIVGEAF